MIVKSHEMRRERRLAALTLKQKPDGLDCYFVEITQQFRPYMERIALSILGDRDGAEDAVSEAVFKAYINLFGFTPEERKSLKAKVWLAEIVRNVCIDRRNKQKEEESLELLMQTGLQVIARPYDRPDIAVLRADATVIINGCLNALSPRDREIVRRIMMLEEPVAVVARDLGISRNALYVALKRAMRKLRHPSRSRQLCVDVGDKYHWDFELILVTSNL